MEHYINFTGLMISFLGMFILACIYNINNHKKTIRTLIIAAFSPAIISIYFIILNMVENQNIIFHIQELPAIKINFGIIADKYTIFFILIALINIALIILLGKDNTLLELRIALINYGITFVILLSPDFFFMVSALSIGSIIIAFFILYTDNNTLIIWNTSNDFLWQRLSDIILVIGFLYIYIEYNTLLSTKLSFIEVIWPRVFLFTAIILRLISSVLNKNSLEDSAGFMAYTSNTIFIIISCLVTILKISNLILSSDLLSKIFIMISILLSIHALFGLFQPQKRNILTINITYFLAAIALINICLLKNAIAWIVLYLIIIFNSLAPLILKLFKFEYIKTNKPPTVIGIIYQILFKISMRSSYFVAEIFSRLIGPFYTNIIFQTVPKLVFQIANIPLRFFHNGTLTRTAIFTLVLFGTYYYFYWVY